MLKIQKTPQKAIKKECTNKILQNYYPTKDRTKAQNYKKLKKGQNYNRWTIQYNYKESGAKYKY